MCATFISVAWLLDNYDKLSPEANFLTNISTRISTIWFIKALETSTHKLWNRKYNILFKVANSILQYLYQNNIAQHKIEILVSQSHFATVSLSITANSNNLLTNLLFRGLLTSQLLPYFCFNSVRTWPIACSRPSLSATVRIPKFLIHSVTGGFQRTSG